tara:strand:+ start:1561 stop:1935 length:375 start_codon:yes stop_codon:yes gene_type:complete
MNTIQSKSVQFVNNNGKISKNSEEIIYNANTGKGIINNNGKIYKFQKKPNDNDIRLIFSQKSSNMNNNLQSILKNKKHYTPMFQTRKRRKEKKKKKRKKSKQKKTKRNFMKKIKNKLKTIIGSN